MRFVQHSSNNFVLGAPEGYDPRTAPHDVGALPCSRILDNGVPAFQSFWKPEPEELEALNKGLPVMLTVLGLGHPVVRIEVAATT